MICTFSVPGVANPATVQPIPTSTVCQNMGRSIRKIVVLRCGPFQWDQLDEEPAVHRNDASRKKRSQGRKPTGVDARERVSV